MRRSDTMQHSGAPGRRAALWGWALALLLWWPNGHALAQGATTFVVTVADKTSEHPYSGQGWSEGFVVDGTQGKVLTLQRGVTYTFQMQNVPSIHPFYISTSEVGAGAGVYSDGVSNNFVSGNQTLTFTPPEDAPDVLYYECGAHQYMGSQINIVDRVSADLELVAEGFTHPVAMAEPPDDTGRLFVVDQTGQIWIVMPDGTMLEEPFLDVSGRMVALNDNYDERGLLGLAFHPGYAENGRLFVYYSAPLREEAPDNWNNTSRISEFTVSSDPNRADPESETILLQVDQPQSNHAAGTLAFGPDGYLYISLGDGGGANDTGLGHVDDWYDANDGGNGQDTEQNLLGSILRIDVDNPDEGMNYGIPDDNPVLTEGGPDEQWAYGFRNPYRFSFDMGGTNMLIAGDAGQNLYEEVSVVTAGGNYGWNVKEGTHCFNAADATNPLPECPDTDPEGDPLIDPVIEFLNSSQEGGLGLTVVGGYVYRGSAIPELDGKYIFGAWSRDEIERGGDELHLPGRILVATPQAEGTWPFEEMTISNMDSLEHFVLGFGQDLNGETYVLMTDSLGPTGSSGKVFRFAPSGSTIPVEPGEELPSRIVLEQNYPNPFNPTTTIRFHLDQTEQVSLMVYDVTGREIKRLVDGPFVAGVHSVVWDGTDAAGKPVASGTYLYRLQTDTESTSRVMTLLK